MNGSCSRSRSRRCSSISVRPTTASLPPRCSAPRSPCSTAGRSLAGVLIGLLAYKPQFGLLIPLVLAVSGRWRVFAAAAATVAAAGARRHARLRHRGVERVPRLHQVHPHCRARAGRHRLVQDPERVRVGAHVGRRRRARLCAARRGDALGRRRAGLAVAQPRRLSAQGRRPADRQRAGDALQPRLRPDAAGAGDRLPRDRRMGARLRALGENHSGRAVDRAAGRPLGAAGHADSASSSNHVAGLRPVAAPRHG